MKQNIARLKREVEDIKKHFARYRLEWIVDGVVFSYEQCCSHYIDNTINIRGSDRHSGLFKSSYQFLILHEIGHHFFEQKAKLKKVWREDYDRYWLEYRRNYARWTRNPSIHKDYISRYSSCHTAEEMAEIFALTFWCRFNKVKFAELLQECKKSKKCKDRIRHVRKIIEKTILEKK